MGVPPSSPLLLSISSHTQSGKVSKKDGGRRRREVELFLSLHCPHLFCVDHLNRQTELEFKLGVGGFFPVTTQLSTAPSLFFPSQAATNSTSDLRLKTKERKERKEGGRRKRRWKGDWRNWRGGAHLV